MDKGRYILEAIMLLQKSGDTPPKLPLYHYILDYSLTIILLTCYGYGVYKLLELIEWV